MSEVRSVTELANSVMNINDEYELRVTPEEFHQILESRQAVNFHFDTWSQEMRQALSQRFSEFNLLFGPRIPEIRVRIVGTRSD